jgi:hypothetical protein
LLFIRRSEQLVGGLPFMMLEGRSRGSQIGGGIRAAHGYEGANRAFYLIESGLGFQRDRLQTSEGERGPHAIEAHGHQDLSIERVIRLGPHPLRVHRTFRPGDHHARRLVERALNFPIKRSTWTNLAIPPDRPSHPLQCLHQWDHALAIGRRVRNENVGHAVSPAAPWADGQFLI